MVCVCRRYGANFLLNVGPRGDGSLSHMDAAILEMVGQWIKINQKAIYEVRPYTIISEDKDFVLRGNNGKYYLFVHDLCICGDLNVVKDGGMAKQVKLFGLKGKCKSIEWLDCHDKVPFEQEGDELLVKAQPFMYGENLVVRIAEIEIE